MEVVCENCNARLNIPDEKLPRGQRVRRGAYHQLQLPSPRDQAVERDCRNRCAVDDEPDCARAESRDT